jgi:hypothetical protein
VEGRSKLVQTSSLDAALRCKLPAHLATCATLRQYRRAQAQFRQLREGDFICYIRTVNGRTVDFAGQVRAILKDPASEDLASAVLWVTCYESIRQVDPTTKLPLLASSSLTVVVPLRDVSRFIEVSPSSTEPGRFVLVSYWD